MPPPREPLTKALQHTPNYRFTLDIPPLTTNNAGHMVLNRVSHALKALSGQDKHHFNAYFLLYRFASEYPAHEFNRTVTHRFTHQTQ